MKHLKDFLQNNLPVKKSPYKDERTELIYEIAKYFNEPVSQWFIWVEKSRLQTWALRNYFNNSKNAIKSKKVQARFLMSKLFPKEKK